MALVNGFRVNTNTSAYNTYRSYGSSQASLEKNIERLSSGLRINRAADDTAGQAITQRMKNQALGMRQAVRNSQQATNYLQTAEGGLNEIHGTLSRMRELAVQSASDNLNSNDRVSLELEYQQLMNEVSRVANSTTYNNMPLINGDKAKRGYFDLNWTDDNEDGSVDESEAINGNVDDSVISRDEISDFSISSNVNDGDSFIFKKIENHKITLKNLGTSTEQTLYHADGGFSEGDNLNFDDLGVTVKLGLKYQNIITEDDVTNTAAMIEANKLVVQNDNFVTVQVGIYNDAHHSASWASNTPWPTENRITFNISDVTAKGLGIDDSDVNTLADSQRAINGLDAAITKVNNERSNIGALQNRFEFAVSNLQSSLQNTDASRSTILDIDFALEAAGMAKHQILTQSGTAMLAQANQISQNVLSLLK